MSDQTPDPWKDVQPRHLCQSCGLDDEQWAWREGFNAAVALALKARDAERQQHQQTIQQQAETIRQLNDTVSRCAIDLLEKNRQIETLTQALERYGKHDRGCGWYYFTATRTRCSCNCGLSKALAGASRAPDVTKLKVMLADGWMLTIERSPNWDCEGGTRVADAVKAFSNVMEGKKDV